MTATDAGAKDTLVLRVTPLPPEQDAARATAARLVMADCAVRAHPDDQGAAGESLAEILAALGLSGPGGSR